MTAASILILNHFRLRLVRKHFPYRPIAIVILLIFKWVSQTVKLPATCVHALLILCLRLTHLPDKCFIQIASRMYFFPIEIHCFF